MEGQFVIEIIHFFLVHQAFAIITIIIANHDHDQDHNQDQDQLKYHTSQVDVM